MKNIVLVLLTNQRGLELTEYAAAASWITHGTTRHIIMFYVEFLSVQQTRLQEQAKHGDFAFDDRHYVGPAKFLPFEPWRNDLLESALLTEARGFLNLPPVGFWSSPLVRP